MRQTILMQAAADQSPIAIAPADWLILIFDNVFDSHLAAVAKYFDSTEPSNVVEMLWRGRRMTS
jgi:hypothetical protein